MNHEILQIVEVLGHHIDAKISKTASEKAKTTELKIFGD